MSEFRARPIVCTVNEEIKAPTSKIFPLLCLGRQLKWMKWMNSWGYQLICSDSEANEEGCVLVEEMAGFVLFGSPVKTKWIATLHEPDTRMQFVLLSADMSVIIFDVKLGDHGNSSTAAQFRFTYIPLREDAIGEATEEKLMLILTSLMSWLRYYCEAGEEAGEMVDQKSPKDLGRMQNGFSNCSIQAKGSIRSRGQIHERSDGANDRCKARIYLKDVAG